MVEDLATISKALGKQESGQINDLIAAANPTQRHEEAAEMLKQAAAKGRGLILLGALAAAHPDYSLLKALAQVIAEATGAKVGYLPAAANSVGAYLAGSLPHLVPGARLSGTAGMSAAAMLESPREAYLLWGIDPAYDLGNPAQGLEALDRATLVVACTTHRTPSLEQTADILLPIAAFADTSGTYVNAAVSWQSFRGAVAPPDEVRPGWKLLRVLGNILDLPGFEQVSSADVLAELKAICEGAKPDIPAAYGFSGKQGASPASDDKAPRRVIAGSIGRSGNAVIGRGRRTSRPKTRVWWV